MYYAIKYLSDDATAGSNQDDFEQVVASNEEKMESEKWAQLSKQFHMKILTMFSASDPVLKILKSTLIGSLRGPVSAPKPATDNLEAIRRITKLLREADFTPGAFDTHAVLDCDRKQLNATCHALWET